ncbi:MAG: hypothetical protein ACLUP5_07005 [Streptococcus sp.]
MISLVVLTYISIVFGELYPKRIAMNLRRKSSHLLSSCCLLLQVRLLVPLFGFFRRQPIFCLV